MHFRLTTRRRRVSALRPLGTGYLCGTFTRQDEQTKQLKLPGKTVWPFAGKTFDERWKDFEMRG
ncbi:MAG: hypothetical protein DSZ34_05255 [Gammaproteobacteria bacterium]|nr:MAG: hypothetical protein DSZ34_05255 [Gammaproteobacteria bacterium]